MFQNHFRERNCRLYYRGSAEGARKTVNEYVHVGSKTLIVQE